MTEDGVAAFSPLVSRTRCNARALLRRAGTQRAARFAEAWAPALRSNARGVAARPGHESVVLQLTHLRILAACFARALPRCFTPNERGRREDRVPAGHPRSTVRKVAARICTAAYRWSQTSGLPCAVVLRLMSCSPRGAMHYCPRRPARWLMRAPGWAATSPLGLDAQTPGVRTTRFCRTQMAPVVCAWSCSRSPALQGRSRQRHLRPPPPGPRS